MHTRTYNVFGFSDTYEFQYTLSNEYEIIGKYLSLQCYMESFI
jgi:hypothetical protein